MIAGRVPYLRKIGHLAIYHVPVRPFVRSPVHQSVRTTGSQCEISHFLGNVGACCNLILHTHVVVN